MYIEDHTNLESFQFEGNWWLPDKPGEILSGILSVSHGPGIRLELIGSFVSLDDPGLGRPFSPRIILGMSAENKPCTLLDTFQNHSAPFSAVPVTKFVANRLYYGCHFKVPEHISFSSMTIRVTYLEDWLGFNPFEVTFDKEKQGFTNIGLSGTLPILDVLIPNGNTKVSITSRSSFSWQQFKEIRLSHIASVRFCPEASKERLWYEQLLKDFQNLMTLLIGEPAHAYKVTGFIKGEDTAPISIEVYMPLRSARVEESISPARMPYPYARVRPQAAGLIQKWFENAEKLRPVYDLLCGTYYNRDSYEESEFLALMQAIETFHRRVQGGKYVSDESYETVYQRLTDAIPAGISESLRQKLRDYLRYGNEFSLRKRLKLAVASIGQPIAEIIPESDNFIELIYNTRNYLTHYEEPSGSIIEGGPAFYEANQKLRMLLRALLFKYFEVDGPRRTTQDG